MQGAVNSLLEVGERIAIAVKRGAVSSLGTGERELIILLRLGLGERLINIIEAQD